MRNSPLRSVTTEYGDADAKIVAVMAGWMSQPTS
jgi:hypothetical protein